MPPSQACRLLWLVTIGERIQERHDRVDIVLAERRLIADVTIERRRPI
jgi:hypothetical protein